MLWAASEEGGGCCAGGANTMSHLGGPPPTNPLPQTFLHSFQMVVAIFNISLDFDIDDDFCLKSWAAAQHYYELYYNIYDGN